MRRNRLFVDHFLYVGQQLTLPVEAAHHISQVLRLKINTPLILFNGQGGEYLATLIQFAKREVVVTVQDYQPIERESALFLTLVQAISRPERMDLTLRKAVELGVSQIVPVVTERSLTLDSNQASKRAQHWQKIIISACEQCGRNRLPPLQPIISLSDWFVQKRTMEEPLLILSPQGQRQLSDVVQSKPAITVLVGAEGGFSEKEIAQAITVGYQDIRLGSRILRTETAAITILALCQALQGDLLT